MYDDDGVGVAMRLQLLYILLNVVTSSVLVALLSYAYYVCVITVIVVVVDVS